MLLRQQLRLIMAGIGGVVLVSIFSARLGLSSVVR